MERVQEKRLNFCGVKLSAAHTPHGEFHSSFYLYVETQVPSYSHIAVSQAHSVCGLRSSSHIDMLEEISLPLGGGGPTNALPILNMQRSQELIWLEGWWPSGISATLPHFELDLNRSKTRAKRPKRNVFPLHITKDPLQICINDPHNSFSDFFFKYYYFFKNTYLLLCNSALCCNKISKQMLFFFNQNLKLWQI